MQVRNFTIASQIFGYPVINSKHEDIGKVKELIINLRNGKIAYAILSFGGILGMGDKLFAIPFQYMKVYPNKGFAVLDISKSALEQAPGFDKNHWPDFNSSAWLDAIDTYFVTCLQESDIEELV